MTPDTQKALVEALPRVWAILHRHCGAKAEMPEDFARSWPKCAEYRFMGALGFGGKIYANHHDGLGWRVGYYPENRTVARDSMVEEANAALARAEAEMSP